MQKERNYGIDLLRITATFMICVYHILGRGGVMQSTGYLSAHWVSSWGLEKLTLCCVNCYGLISGYVGVESRHRPASLLRQWLQVAFYSVGITLLFELVWPQKVSLAQLLASFAPVSTSQYWYFSAYVGLFVLMPLLNHAVNAMDGRRLGRMLAAAAAVLTLPTALLDADPFTLGGGYSTLWLALLYLIGAWFRRHGHAKKHRWLLVYLLCCLTMLAIKMISDYAFLHYDFRVLHGSYSSFVSPLVLLCGVALLTLFSRLNVRRPCVQKAIRPLAAASFGVYLIHVHPLVWDHLFLMAYARFAQWPIPAMLLGVLAAAIGLFAACALAESVRIWLFEKLRIHALADALGAKLASALGYRAQSGQPEQ